MILSEYIYRLITKEYLGIICHDFLNSSKWSIWYYMTMEPPLFGIYICLVWLLQ
jgi:hypothetical protein